MFRTLLVFSSMLLVALQTYGGDSMKQGKTEPGQLAQQYYRETLAGQPGPNPPRTDAMTQRFFTGAAAGDLFGYSVASAGDVNGDGYADVILGALYNDAGGPNAGRAYIYFGGPVMDATADIIFTGAAAADRFGYSVAGAGDVNGDGYSDVIVGAYDNDAGGNQAGQAYIYFGGAVMDSTKDVTLTGAAIGDYFGWSVGGAGDVNGDGYSDVIVGAPYNDAGGMDAGRAFIYFGGAAMDSTKDVTLTGAAAGDNFGRSVASAGDVNGDGYADVIVGAPYNAAGGANAGRAYIYFGGPGMDALADAILTGEAAGDIFGYSVACAGDVNGDGYSDVIVGAYYNDAGGTNAGRAYIYFGGIAMDALTDVTLTGAAAGELFGYSVASAGDVNGDGYSDVIVGAHFNNAGGFETGRAYIYFGSAVMDALADVTLTGAAAGDRFGSSVASAGDVNGDGYGDVIVGAYLNDAGGTQAGRAYIYRSSSPPIVPRIMAVKDVPFDQGGKVTVRWVRSGYDARGINTISSYQIERSRPPGVTGFAWELVGSTSPRQNPMYEQTMATGYDSMANTSGTFYFRITARTAYADQYWRSNIMSGHSADNLAPSAVGGLSASLLTPSSVRLHWPANTRDSDLGGYVLYRSTTGGFVPADSNRVLALTDTSYLDASIPSSPMLYYRVCARDIHGNLGNPSVQAAVPISSTQTFSVRTSWNMISVPLQVEDFRKTTLYATATSQAFAYNAGYVTKDTLENGRGYWLKFPSAQNVSLTGFPLSTGTIAVTSGWNMVGSIGVAVPVSQITSNPPGLVVSSFFTYASGYVTAESIEPHKAYWVKVQQNGELVLSSGGGTTGAVQIVETGEKPPDPPFMTAVAEGEIPTVFALEQNYPNPFNPSTTIQIALPQPAKVRLTVYSLLGQEIAELVNAEYGAGYHAVEFRADGLASGVYLYRMEAGPYTAVKKFVVMK